MSYAPTTWATGDTITATKMNNLETQYADVFAGGVFTGAAEFGGGPALSTGVASALQVGGGYASPAAGKVAWGDGSGWQLQFVKSTTGAVIGYITDSGNFEGWSALHVQGGGSVGVNGAGTLYVGGSDVQFLGGGVHIGTGYKGAPAAGGLQVDGYIFPRGAGDFGLVNNTTGWSGYKDVNGQTYIHGIPSANAVSGFTAWSLQEWSTWGHKFDIFGDGSFSAYGGNITGGRGNSGLGVVNGSGVELQFTGATAANVYADQDLYILAGSAGTGSLNLGSNGVNGRVTLDASGNLYATGNILSAAEFSGNGINLRLAGGSGANAGRVEAWDRLSVASGYSWGSFPDPGAGGLYVTGNAYLTGAHVEDPRAEGTQYLGAQSQVAYGPIAAANTWYQASSYGFSQGNNARYLIVNHTGLGPNGYGSVKANIDGVDGPSHAVNSGSQTFQDVWTYGVAGVGGSHTLYMYVSDPYTNQTVDTTVNWVACGYRMNIGATAA